MAMLPTRVDLDPSSDKAELEMRNPAALSHDLGLPFTQADRDAMLEYVGRWA